MKVLNFISKYRLYIGLVLLALAIYVNIEVGFWPAFILYLLAAIFIISYFILGPIREIQLQMEAGDLEGAKKTINNIKFPGLLIKPMRSVYYTLKGNMAMMDQDFNEAEKYMKKGLQLGGGMLTQQTEGPNKLQLGMLAAQRGNLKESESYIKQAIRAGLPDSENNAMAFLQLASIAMNKRDFRQAKEYFRKAKSYKPTTPELVSQIKQIEKYIARVPG